jgi:hypothetical protein
LVWRSKLLLFSPIFKNFEILETNDLILSSILAERRLRIGLMIVRELVESTKQQLVALLFKRLRE